MMEAVLVDIQEELSTNALIFAFVLTIKHLSFVECAVDMIIQKQVIQIMDAQGWYLIILS